MQRIPMVLSVSALLAGAAVPLSAQAHDHSAHSPYAGMESRAIKALSPEEIAGLRAGEGLGMALAAELNGLPGPKHVLELAESLSLTAEQTAGVQEIAAEMQAAAQELGGQIIQAEEHLDRLFASGDAAEADVSRMTQHIGAMRGQLRAVHLNAHLAVSRLLTAEQVAAYQQQRGYAGSL
ncbi:MAG: Spy/CpxP family protein refolding chaperone [Gemmatimonadota bacterium]